MKGKLNLRFGKKKNNDTNNNDTNNVIFPTDTKPPRISLMLNPKDNVLSDILPVVSTTSPVEVKSSITKNSGLLDEILGELNTTSKFFLKINFLFELLIIN